MPTKPYNKHTLKVMLKRKKDSLIYREGLILDACKQTLEFYARSKLIGCEQYYIVKSEYIKAHKNLLKLRGKP